jgi:AcrR family transcriptional regulator
LALSIARDRLAMKTKTTTGKPERTAQRRRTRKAIIEAATALLSRGAKPSIADVAAAAEVSRRTVYMYFPTLEQLLIDATLGALSQDPVDHAIAAPQSEDDVEERVERMVRAVHRVSPEVERLGRTLIRLTVESDGVKGRGAAASPRRGYRRVEWIENAVTPLRTRLNPARFERLVSGLAMVIGWEALIVQRDIRGHSASEGEELSVWAARALLRASLEERPPTVRPLAKTRRRSNKK